AGGEVWLDMRDRIDNDPQEGGLLSIAFHPDFNTNGHVYLNSTRTDSASGFHTLVSRVTVPNPPLGSPDPATEVEVLRVPQPFGNHNGGVVVFGPDGMLYVGMGDGGAADDPYGHGQNLGTLLGAFLRLDVNTPDWGPGYIVPPDNPWLGAPGARSEIWAYGLRNPWRFSFDPVSGTLWTGDVGQDDVEEIDIIERGGNYGWNVMEGSSCFLPAFGCDEEGLILPVDEYPNPSLGKSVTGGFVYRGTAMPALTGAYIFGDFAYGTIWSLAPNQDGTWERTQLLETSLKISAFGVDGDGEILVVDWDGSPLYRLIPSAPDAQGAPGWPPTLSETGCFSDLPSRTLAPGILSYAVNMPLWSDSAPKERSLALPDGGTMGYRDIGTWDLPEGSILIKSFLNPYEPASALETRFMVRGPTSWRWATYRWNEEQTDGELLTTSADADLGQGIWHFPSRGECGGCHTEASGEVLGLETQQLRREHDMFRTGVPVDQVDALIALGYVTGAPTPVALAQPFPEPGPVSEADDLERSARAYLHTNCAHCHQPQGLGIATVDLRFHVPLGETGACDGEPQQGDLGVVDAKIIAPGDPARSTLWLRMVSEEPSLRMPETNTVDPVGAALVEAWIQELEGCP
ncbi:MAG: PQQ-dependent sugar dehydrogenase, partial [Actinomycetota bacterium]|nr:PQQ-dependent sugar dehydrogenase [Actinomycetota bacterium]